MELAAPDPTPALTRGLIVLRLLGREGPSSLEQLAQRTGWPKSSVFRLLASLERFGAVSRDPESKQYGPSLRLVSAIPAEERLRALTERALKDLCRASGQTTEIFLFAEGTLTMLDRREPEEGEVRVRARIGWRPTPNEAFALTVLTLAHGLDEEQWPRGRFWRWQLGRRMSVSRPALRAWVAQARAESIAVCRAPNANGVRRYAAPIHDEEARLWGALSIASTAPDPRERHHVHMLRLISSAAKELAAAEPPVLAVT